MINKHKVSVVITTYNRKVLLIRAIKSVISQTYNNIEIIISDDCSDIDLTDLICAFRQETNIPIIYRRNEKNSGACITRNEGIKLATGFFIAGLDDDDEFTPRRIELLVQSYKPEFSFVTSNTTVISKSGPTQLFKSSKRISLNDLMWGNIVGTQVLVEKEKILSLSGFDEILTSAQDADMWIRLVQNFGDAFRINDSLYILHTEHEEGRISTSSRKIKGMITAFNKHSDKMSKTQMKYHQLKISFFANNQKVGLYLLKNLSFRFLPYLVYKKFFI
jgi:glycosyltransferase involved in cell wall biosynthesis